MNARTSMIHVRIEDDTKEGRYRRARRDWGCRFRMPCGSSSKRVVADQAFPLELKVPNAATREAMQEADGIAAKTAPRASPMATR